jgi:hypothetical protein
MTKKHMVVDELMLLHYFFYKQKCLQNNEILKSKISYFGLGANPKGYTSIYTQTLKKERL